MNEEDTPTIPKKPKKKPRTGTDYGLKSRCILNTQQSDYCEELLDKATKFWNILVYEQSRALWLRNKEIKDININNKPKLELLISKLELRYIERGKTKTQIEKLLEKHTNKFYRRIEHKWNDDNPVFWVCWFDFQTTFKEWGFTNLIKEYVQIKEYARKLYGQELFDKWYSIPRTRDRMAIKGDSVYQWGTTRLYKDNPEPLGLPSAVALGVVKSLHETWSLVKMLPTGKINKDTKLKVQPFITSKGHPKTKNDKRGKRLKLSSLRFDSGNASAITKQLPETKGFHPIKIPSFKDPIMVNFHRLDESMNKVCYFTLNKEGDEWYFSLNVNSNKTFTSPKNPNTVVGVDLGITTLITATDENNKTFSLQKLSKIKNRLIILDGQLQRQNRHISRLARCCEDLKNNPSNNYKRALIKKASIQNKINRINKNLRHHVSNVLTKKYGYIIMEDLKVKDMSKAEGNSKKLLNRNILAQGWGEIMLMITYKGKQRGSNLIKVNPAYTSQTCSECGHCEKNNRKTQANFKCVKCNHQENADVNASKNILKLGLIEIENNSKKDIDNIMEV